MKNSLIGACAGVAALSLPLAAQKSGAGAILPPAQQIAAATAAAPAELRAGATVLGYDASKKLVKLREGTGDMVCLANDPSGDRFHVACYHKLLEPFMARGRSLRAGGVKGPQVDTVRFKEIKSGALKMPSTPSAPGHQPPARADPGRPVPRPGTRRPNPSCWWSPTASRPRTCWPGGRPYFQWPPEAETIEAAGVEVDRMTTRGATVNVFTLDDEPRLAHGVRDTPGPPQRRPRARADPRRLGQYVVSDYLSRRAGRRTRRAG